MNWILVILGLILLVNLWLAYKFTHNNKKEGGEGLKLLLTQLNELNRSVDQKMGEGNKTMHEFMNSQSSQSQKLMSTITKQISDQLLEVVKGVSETKESTKQVFTIAEQLKNLEKVLKNQKQRGNLGEASLELILSNVLPGQYETQYMFKDGEKVDFIVKTKDGLLPVDAKFPLENYIRLMDEPDEERKEIYKKDFKNDVKRRIDETAKYIRPEEGTMPFAFMFIPHEAIYYDLLVAEIGSVKVNTRDLIEYAFAEKHVIIVSPTSFLAYLQTIIEGLRAMQIEESTKEIIKKVEDLRRHINTYDDNMARLGKNLGTTVGAYDRAYKELGKIDKDVLKITGKSVGVEPISIEAPASDLD